MRTRFLAAVGILTLSASACHRAEEPAKTAVDLSPLCAEPATLSALKAELLPPGQGRRYDARLKTARVVLSDVRASGSDAGMATCTATAQLISPVVKDDPKALQHLSFSVRPGEGNRPELTDLQAADGGDPHAFAELLRHPKPEPEPALAAAPPPAVQPAALETPGDADDSAAPRTTRTFSAQTQSLIDQAGDTRTAPANDDSSKTPDASALNSIAGTY